MPKQRAEKPAGLTELVDAAERAREWLFAHALPFWARLGPNPKGGFREILSAAGAPTDDAPTRVRVQARQTYCFARAALDGWQPDQARELVRHGLHVLLGPARRDDGLYGRDLDTACGQGDDAVDLYDCAFVVLALVWAARALDDRSIAAEASMLAARIDRGMRHPEDGYRERVPASAARLQNPHMHLLEASIAQIEANGDSQARERSARMVALARSRFLDARGRLHEAFGPGWTPHAADRFEAGHQFEWVWLLERWRILSGDPQPVEALYAFGLSLADPRGRLALSHHTDTLAVREAVQRCWSQTEALKAHLAMAARGDPAAPRAAIACFDRLWQDHILPAPDGAWIDRVSPAGAPLAGPIPASTFYHLYLALRELVDQAGVASGGIAPLSDASSMP